MSYLNIEVTNNPVTKLRLAMAWVAKNRVLQVKNSHKYHTVRQQEPVPFRRLKDAQHNRYK